jgi:anti-sigma factor RsiW
VRCDQVSPSLSAVADGTAELSADAWAHVEHCLRCQAEVVQHRRVLRAVHSLRNEVLEPAPGLLTDVLAALEEAGERQAVRSLVRRHRLAYVGGLAAATAAGAAGAIVIASRSRRHRPALAG